jgi:hypothetical protein
MPRATRFVLLAFLLVTSILVTVRLSEYKSYFVQHNAGTYVVQLFVILIAYVIAIVFVGRLKGTFWVGIFRLAMIFGLASGLLEILTIGAENNIFAFRIPQLLGILSVFAIWGVAGFSGTLTLKSVKAGVLSSIASAAICMLIGVASGVWVEMFVAPPNPAIVASWQEFKRSGWTDPGAFQIANTLDSAFGHLLLAPVVGMVFGVIGSGLGRVLWLSQSHSAA